MLIILIRRPVNRARARRAFAWYHLTQNKKLQQHGEGRMQAAMAKRKRHSRGEIASKLAQANDLATQGKLQSEIARTLGVSVMTLYRWSKAPPGPRPVLGVTHEAGQPSPLARGGARSSALQLEKRALRRPA